MEELTPPLTNENQMPVRVNSARGPAPLIFSGTIAVVILCLEAYFQYHGKSYVVPEMAWTIILAPWLGDGAGKVAEVLTKLKRKK